MNVFVFFFYYRFLQNIFKKILHGIEKKRKYMVVKQKAEQSEDDTENKKKITMFINKCKEVYVS